MLLGICESVRSFSSFGFHFCELHLFGGVDVHVELDVVLEGTQGLPTTTDADYDYGDDDD